MKTINVVSYQRVSTQKQETERQQKEIEDYCKIKKFNLITEFVEKESGLKEQRTELTNLLNFCKEKNNQVDYVMVVELSRLGRTKELLNTKDKLHSYGVGIIALKENLTSLNQDKTVNQNVNMIFGIMSSMNEYEVDVIKGRMRGGRITKTSQGFYMNNPKVAYGYIVENIRLVINPDEAGIINEMVEMFLSGKGTYTIAKHLNQKGIVTRLNKTWYPNVIYQILTNQNLIGKRIYLGVEYECPAILDQKTFDKIQERLKNNSNKQGINKKHDYLFDKQIIKCGVCGRFYYPTLRKGGKQSVYSCTSNIYPYTKCGNRGLGITKLENSITDYIFKYFSEIIVDQLKKQNFTSEIKKLEDNLNPRKIYLKKRLNREDILLEERLNGSISSEKYHEKLKVVKNEIENVNSEISKIEKEIDEINEVQKKQTDILEIEKLLKTDNANSKKYIRSIIDEITIYPADKVMSKYPNDHSFKLILKIQRQYFTIYLSHRSIGYEPIFPDYAKYKDFFKEYNYQPILLK